MKLRKLFIGLLVCWLVGSLTGCDKITSPGEVRGPKWKMYTTDNSPLVSNTINALTVYSGTTVWIATDAGANSITGESWQVVNDSLVYFTPLGASAKVNAITVGGSGEVWFGLAGGGVRKMKPFYPLSDKWQHYNSPVINTDFVYSLATHSSGDIYVGTSNGVSRFIPDKSDLSKGKWIKYSSKNSPLPDEQIRSIGINPFDNLIWFGTQSHGVVSYDGDLLWNIDSPSDVPFPIVSMTFASASTAWFGTFADWAYRYSIPTSEWTHVADSSNGTIALKDLFVNAVASTQKGVVWFGTNKGLTRFDGSTWQTLDTTNSPLQSEIIKALAVDVNNNLWIGTVHGLAVYNEEGILR